MALTVRAGRILAQQALSLILLLNREWLLESLVLLHLTARRSLSNLLWSVRCLQDHLVHVLVLRVVDLSFGRLLRIHISGCHWL